MFYPQHVGRGNFGRNLRGTKEHFSNYLGWKAQNGLPRTDTAL
jgi:hypothetical protein